jgi:hypothetical protein
MTRPPSCRVGCHALGTARRQVVSLCTVSPIPEPDGGLLEIHRPDPQHISTSYVERQNWTVRTTMRRYTRLSNGFSRKIENHMAAVAINYFAYNFIKIHRTLRVSPAMAAGVTHRLFDVSDLVALLIESESKKPRS